MERTQDGTLYRLAQQNLRCLFSKIRIRSYRPSNNVTESDITNFNWKSIGADPYFDLQWKGHCKKGWLHIHISVNHSVVDPKPKLYVDYGWGISESTAIALPSPINGMIQTIVNLSDPPTRFRFAPMDEIGYFSIQRIILKPITPISACMRMIRDISRASSHPDHKLSNFIRKNLARLRKKGFSGMMTNLSKDYTRFVSYTPTHTLSYKRWIALYDTLNDSDRAAIRHRIEQLRYKPSISVLMPVFNTPERYLRAAIDSVRNQLYENWELCIANDASTEGYIRRVLDAYSSKDARIKVMHREETGHISSATNSALEMASGQFVMFLDHDDELTEHALYRVVLELNEHPDTQILYSDEDKIDEFGVRFTPHFKPDWNSELFYSINYICHLAVYRADLVRSVDGLRVGFEGSQDYDLALRCIAKIEGKQLRHIPEILYHWRAIEDSTAKNVSCKSYATPAGLKALREHFQRLEPDVLVEKGAQPTSYRVRYPIKGNKPKVSLIIPSRNGYELICRCVESILSKTRYPNFEMLIIDNQSDDPQALEYLNSLQKSGNVKILSYDYSFNYSAINNFAVGHADGDVLCLMNNDIEAIESEWLEEMVSYAIRPDVGAVGAKLLYPDDRIQHAGIILGIGGVAGHSQKFFNRSDSGYFGRLLLPQSLSAVTGACMVLRKALYKEVGGLEEVNLPVAFNDVDLCLRIREAGYRNIWTPYAELYHHESASRGYDDTPEKQARFVKEVNYMKETWGERLLNDPYYNPNLTFDREDFSLAYPPRAQMTISRVH